MDYQPCGGTTYTRAARGPKESEKPVSSEPTALPAPSTVADRPARPTPSTVIRACTVVSAVLTAKDAVAKQADAGPAKYRSAERGTIAQTAARAVDVAKKGVLSLLGVKGGSKAKVLSRQEQQKVKEAK